MVQGGRRCRGVRRANREIGRPWRPRDIDGQQECSAGSPGSLAPIPTEVVIFFFPLLVIVFLLLVVLLLLVFFVIAKSARLCEEPGSICGDHQGHGIPSSSYSRRRQAKGGLALCSWQKYRVSDDDGQGSRRGSRGHQGVREGFFRLVVSARRC